MTKKTSKAPSKTDAVEVTWGKKTDPQPEPFRLCPLGCQFYTRHPVREFSLLEFELPARGKKSILCTGTVVRCEKEPDGRNRVWLQFLDKPIATMKRITCTSKKGGHICSYCENF